MINEKTILNKSDYIKHNEMFISGEIDHLNSALVEDAIEEQDADSKAIGLDLLVKITVDDENATDAYEAYLDHELSSVAGIDSDQILEDFWDKKEFENYYGEYADEIKTAYDIYQPNEKKREE